MSLEEVEHMQVLMEDRVMGKDDGEKSKKKKGDKNSDKKKDSKKDKKKDSPKKKEKKDKDGENGAFFHFF